MEFQGKYNVKSPAVKRLMREACELQESTEEYWAHPLEDNLFEWHFTVRGPPVTDFDGGVYHGRILLPAEYPMKPPNIILLTPNGRFETNKKICLSISGHHPETWQPSWSIRTALMALIAFMPSPGGGTIGSLDYPPEERQVLARRSQSWECPACGRIIKQLSNATSKPLTKEESSLISQISMKAEDANSVIVPGPTEPGTDVDNGARENVDSIEVRQRLTGRTEPTPQVIANVGQEIQHTAQVNSHNNNYKNILMWILICAIGLLIYRRLFLI